MEAMRDLLRGSLGESLKAMPPLDRLAAAWPVACGPALGAHGLPLGFDGGVLTIAVADRAWLDQLHTMGAGLARELTRIAGLEVREIHFELRRSTR